MRIECYNIDLTLGFPSNQEKLIQSEFNHTMRVLWPISACGRATPDIGIDHRAVCAIVNYDLPAVSDQ